MNRHIAMLAAAGAIAALIAGGCKKVQELAHVGGLDEVVNTSSEEFAPIISADGKTLYFTSNRGSGLGGEDIWKTRRIAGLWTRPVCLGAPLNTEMDEGLDTFSQDEKTLYMTSDSRPGGLGKNDIYVSRREGKQWSEPRNLGAPVNTEYNDANASLSANGKTLYFVSDRPGGAGGYDIWFSEQTPDGKWGEPANLGAPVNTSGWEGVVFIAPDGDTVYFSSNGHGGYGGADILRSRRQPEGWSEPENLGNKINTAGNDAYFTIPGSGDMAYLSSTREGGKGENDIIALPLPSVFEPKKIVVLLGSVLNADNNKPLKAWAKIKYRPTNQTLYVAETKPNGSFRVCFEPQKELVLMVYTDEPDFKPWYETLSLNTEQDNQVLKRNILMAPGKEAVIQE